MVVLEDSIEIFRKNIFSMTDRRQIPYLIYQILERELLLEEAGLNKNDLEGEAEKGPER